MVPEVTSRHHGLDAVRGLALLSMFVAHGAPYARGSALEVVDHLTAPLFAVLVGASLALGRPGWQAPLVRGGCLVLLGLALEPAGAQVVLVLAHLGVLTWLVALVRRAPSWVHLGAVVALWVTGPALQRLWWPVHGELQASGGGPGLWLVELFFVGGPYRVATLLVWALLGLLVTRHLLLAPAPGQPVAGGAIALGAALLVHAGVVLATGADALRPYSGTRSEVALDALLAVGVLLVVSPWLGGRSWIGPLERLGRMSLSLYVVHVLWLAWLGRVLLDGRHDDGWATLASLVLGAVVLGEGWNRWGTTRRLGRGPVEAVVDRLVRAAAPRT